MRAKSFPNPLRPSPRQPLTQRSADFLVLFGAVAIVGLIALSTQGATAMPMPEGKGSTDPAVSENTGAANLQIPIEVPPGAGGLAPQIRLSYSSHQGDGPYGIGWDLNLGEIQCSQRFGVPDYGYGSCARFEFNGQLLTRDGASDSYHTFVESFQKVEYLGASQSWEVTNPNGMIQRYGVDPDARVYSGLDIARWLLSEIEDPFGNVIYVSYDDTTDPGTRYPIRLTYGADATKQVGKRSVELVFGEDRPDPIHDYVGGIEREITKRLTDIKVLSYGSLVRRYAFGYDGNDEEGNPLDYTTGRTRLSWVQVFGSDCPGEISSCVGLPRQEYVYTDSMDDGTTAQYSKFDKDVDDPENYVIDFGRSLYNRPTGIRIADVNGDGLSDVIEGGYKGGLLRELQQPGYAFNNLKVKINTGSGFVEDPAWSDALSRLEVARPRVDFVQIQHDLSTSGIQTALHFNSLGIIDESPNSTQYSVVSHRLEDAAQADMSRPEVRYSTSPASSPPPGSRRSGWIEGMGRLFFADIDGDGLSDIVVSVRLSGVDKVLDAQGAAIPTALVQREAGISLQKVYRNSGDPAVGWVEDDSLAAGLPAFGVVQIESDYGAESKIPFGVGPDPADPFSGMGVQGSGIDVAWNQDQIDACSVRGLYGGSNPLVPEEMVPEVCINLIDLAPRFVDFNGDGYVDVMALTLEDPTALHQGALFAERGTNAPPVAANHARSEAWIQIPNATAGDDRWVRASQYDLPNVPFRSPEYGGAKSMIGTNGIPWTDDGWIRFAHAQPKLSSGAAPPPGCPGSGLFGSNQWEFCAPLSFNVDTGVRLVDLNRDGLSDVIWSLYDYGILEPDGYPEYPLIAQGVLLNTGTGWCSSVAEIAVHVESYCAHAAVYYPPASNFPQTPLLPFDPPGPSGFGFFINGHLGPPSGYLADLNADGFLDYIQAHNTSEYVGKKAWLFDPAGASQQPPNVWIRDDRYDLDIDYGEIAIPPDPDYLGFALFDVDGDGAVDILGDDLKDQNGIPVPQVFLSKSKHSDLLRLVRNGTGGETSIVYESAIHARNSVALNPAGNADIEADAAAHAVLTGEALVSTGAAPVDVIRWSTKPVVSEISIAGPNRAPDPAFPGQVFSAPTRYRYAHPRYCAKSRSDLGFRVVERTRPGGEVITSRFYQAHGRAGRISQISVSDGGVDVHRHDAFWETQEFSAQLPQDPGRPLVPGSQNGSIDHGEVYVGRLAGTRSYNEYTGGSGALTQTTYHYDDEYGYGYNFVEKSIDDRMTGRLVTLREPASDLAYSIFGLVGRQKLLDHDGDINDDDYLKDTVVAYQGGRRSSLIDRVKRRGAPGTGIDEAHSTEYDVYGNVTKEIVRAASGDRITDYCFDGDNATGEDAGWCPDFAQNSHSILVGIMDGAGGVATFEPDPGTGAIVETTSSYADQPAMSVNLDTFGRPIESFVHDGSSWLQTAKTVYDDLPFSPGVITRFSYPEPGASDNGALWSSIVSDGFGGVWKEIGETRSGFVGTATYHDPFTRIVQKSLPVDCAGDAACSNLSGASEKVASLSQVDAVGRLIYSETPHGFSVYDYASASAASIGGPWPASNQSFDVVLEKNGKGDLIQKGLDGSRVAWVDECQNTVLASATNISGTGCTGGTSGGAARTFYRYEATGEVGAIFDPRIDSSFSDPNHVLTYHYDTLGRVVQIDDPALAGSGSSQTSYDTYGNLGQVTNARLQTRTHSYDDLDRLTSIVTPSGETDYSVSYRSDEKRASGDSSDDYQRTLTFDGLGRVQKEQMAVRGGGNRVWNFHTDYTYDLLGRVREILYPARHFDIYGWRDSVVRYEYDGEFLEQVCDLGSGDDCDSATLKYVTSTDFDSLGRLSAITSPAGTRRFEYTTDTHRLAKDEFSSPAYQYTRDYVDYDGVGNITSITGSESALPALDMNESYVYDQRNRIERWTKDGAQRDYDYDDLGNLTMHAGQLQVFDDPTRPHAITRRNLSAPSPTTYQYDEDGNIESIVGDDSSRYFGFDSGNRVICLGDNNTTCDTRVAYDVDGKRVAEYQVGGRGFSAYIGEVFRYQHSLIVDHASIIVMLDGKRIALKRFRPQLRAASSSWMAVRIPAPWVIGGLGFVCAAGVLWLIWSNRKGDFVLVRRRPLRSAVALTTISLLLVPSIALGAVPTNASPPNYFWEITDSLGTGMVLVNENGERVRHQTFTPFGEVHDEVGGNFRTIFAGHRRDEGSGMFSMQARWYDPGSGSFLSIDPLIPSATDPQSLNPYSYARNNPLNLTDPDGRCWRAGISCGIDQPALAAVQTRTTTVTILAGGQTISEFSLSETINVSGGIFGGTPADTDSLSSATGATRTESSTANSTGSGVSTGPGFWRGLGRFLRGEALEIFGAIVGTLYGIGKGIYQIGKGILTGSLQTIGAGFANLGATLMFRSGSASGLLHPGKGGAITPGTGTKLDNASVWHDGQSNLATSSAAQFGWIKRAWTGRGAELGPWGQIYRIYGTVGFAIIGGGQAALGL